MALADATVWPNMTIQGLLASDVKDSAAVKAYDRFYSDPSFIGNAYNWSGVGQTAGNSDWGTMISPTYFVSAAHHHPGIGETLTFYYTNNPANGSEARTIIGGSEIGSGDVWLGQLGAPVSSKVAKYPILNLNSFSGNSYYASQPVIYTFGIGYPGSAPVGSNGTLAQRLGRNNIDKTHFDDVDVGNNTIEHSMDIWWDFDNPGGVGANESRVEQGSSAGPNFVILNVGGVNMPALVGTNFIRTDGSPGVVTGSGSVLIPEYLPGIQSMMAESGEQPSLVGRWSSPNVVAQKGDFNLDGVVNSADVQAMLDAMRDIGGYESLHGLSDAYTIAMGDFSGNGKLDNRDVQGLISYIAGGGTGSLSVVPEPATVVLLALGAWPVWRMARRRNIGRALTEVATACPTPADQS
jgi:hypothetical protein